MGVLSTSVRRRVLLSTMLVLFLGSALTTECLADSEGPGAEAIGGPVVNINDAGVEELITLPGIGEAMAERIVSFRRQHGRFKRVEDLMKVKGIGEKSFQKLRPRIAVDDPSRDG